MNPAALNVLLETEGKMTESVSPNRTTKATLALVSHVFVIFEEHDIPKSKQLKTESIISTITCHRGLEDGQNSQDINEPTCPSPKCSFPNIRIPQQTPIGKNQAS